MGVAHFALVAVSSFLTANSSLLAVSPPNANNDKVFIESVLFQTPIREFDRSRFMLRRQNQWLDWTTDGCSIPVIGGEGRSFNFSAACRRHDFGYRNFKLLDQRYNCPEYTVGSICGTNSWSYGRYWNSLQRQKIDDQFKLDMLENCASRSRTMRARCEAWALTYFQSVRLVGGL